MELTLVPYESAGAVFAGAKDGAWDVAFLAIDPVRAAELRFTAPYVIIEGGYLVRDDSAIRTLDAVDVDGLRVAVGRNAAYDLYLSRNLEHATLVREETSRAAIDLFLTGGTDVAAGIRTVLAREAATRPALRLLDGAFMSIRQAMATPADRELGAPYLREFVEEMKASGFVAEALARSGQTDAVVAPLENA